MWISCHRPETLEAANQRHVVDVIVSSADRRRSRHEKRPGGGRSAPLKPVAVALAESSAIVHGALALRLALSCLLTARTTRRERGTDTSGQHGRPRTSKINDPGGAFETRGVLHVRRPRPWLLAERTRLTRSVKGGGPTVVGSPGARLVCGSPAPRRASSTRHSISSDLRATSPALRSSVATAAQDHSAPGLGRRA